MRPRILITGSAGLVGKAVRFELNKQNYIVQGLDLRGEASEVGDIRDPKAIYSAVKNCDGIIHLAAVSRVIWGEKSPAMCWETNVEGVRHVIDAALHCTPRPWVIFASSREVYGQPEHLPANEDTPRYPVNIYGRSKLMGELLIQEARLNGLQAAIVRLSNVYGCVSDHHDRVIPAFARAAVNGEPLRVEGASHTFDFTHVDDTARGIVALAQYLESGNSAPLPLHFLTGQSTTLAQLAALTIELANTNPAIIQATPRSFDVSQFYGCTQRSRAVLGWVAKISLREGLTRLIHDLKLASHTHVRQGTL